jgi:methylenetetrahydrofolate dehydrogenase (NADP+)/methenyltetrahydrofolate cyclohydrolase
VQGVALDEEASLTSLREIIISLNEDPAIHAILVQNPLPLTQRRLVGQILTPNKDVEGLTATHLGWLMLDEAPVPPCTPAAILALIESRTPDLAGRRVVIVNNSATIGRPLSQLLLNRRATVTVCSDTTIDLPSETRRAEILVVAIGQPRAIGAAHVGDGALVIDVGINPDPDGKGVCGDVDTEAVLPLVQAVTPVPGGVGPVTTAVLLENTAKLARHYGGRQETEW